MTATVTPNRLVIGPLNHGNTIYLHNELADKIGIQKPVVFINGNKLDCRRENLRTATNEEFQQFGFDTNDT